MADVTVRHRLDLALRLVDTATGSLVTGLVNRVLLNEKAVHPLFKDNELVFVGIGRENVRLTVEALGYEEKRVTVSWNDLDENIPILELHLIPSLYYQASIPCHTLSGTLPGVAGICAVKVGEAHCLIRGFDKRRRILTIFNPHKLEMGNVFYAVVDPEGESFETFRIRERYNVTDYLIDPALEKPYSNHFPVTRLVFGSVTEGGDYLLRVRDDGGSAKWLVRYMLDREERFQLINFTADKEPKLGDMKSSGAAPFPPKEG